ncbi:DUF5994 family protein [Amycolatopsis sp. NPDC023774]|uniref:DUF5994 family protein n=1 Tax=Amycolatopsis sp. NPDC023774 TaxID=3155015 RepID=UPI0033EA5C50
MKPDPRTQTWRPGTAATHHLLRLRLKPKDTPPSTLDGSWWPRSRDLLAELPPLVEVLAMRLGYITRVTYVTTEWDNAPRRMEIAGHVVHLHGTRAGPGHLVTVTGPEPHRISLLTIPPGAPEVAGHDALIAASRRDNGDRAEEILAASGGPERTRPS